MGPIPPSLLPSPTLAPPLFKQVITSDAPFQGGRWGCGLCTLIAIYDGQMVHTPHHKSILSQWRITKKVIVPEHSKSASELDSFSCAYKLSHKPKMMLHLSKADHWLTPHPLLELAAHAVHLFAVISVCSGWESNWRCYCFTWPLLQCPWSPGAHGPSPEHVQRLAAVPSIHPCAMAVASHASVASMLGCGKKDALLGSYNKLGLFQTSQ